MVRPQRTPVTPSESREFLTFEKVSVRSGELSVFKNTNWTWRAGEQWGILGPDGSGKSLFVEAIMGRAWTTSGEVRGPFPAPGAEGSPEGPTIGHVSPQTQREIAAQEASFYQLRWHSGLDQGPQTVKEFLSQANVEEHNPFEVGARRGSPGEFLRQRRQFVEWLGVGDLLRRRLVHLSNGEFRKTLLIHELLKSPCLLVLEDPFAGLDAATRNRLAGVVARLMQAGWPILVATHRPEDIPAATTHLLLIDDHQVLAQGKKKQMLGIWKKRFGGSLTRASRKTEPRLRPLGNSKPIAWGQPLVELRSVTVKSARQTILLDVDWTLREGECWALLGPNGAGKTTLLNLIQGDHPQAYAQDIWLFGRPTDGTQALWRARQQIGWMSPELHQHYPGGWTALEVVCSGFFNSVGLHETCSRSRRGSARQWLQDLGLAQYATTSFGDLSFGRQRLVLLARAAVKQPRLLILDEPCQGLDETQRRTLLGAVDRTVAQTGASLIFVSHRKNEFPRCISHVMQIAKGRIQNAGPKS